MLRVEENGPFERILTLTIEPELLREAEDKTARRLAREVKIKGFRPGKAPRQVVERVVGAGTLRREAIDDALPELVADALAESELQPAVVPSLADLRDDGEDVEVDVRITLWPAIEDLPEYEGRKVALSSPSVSEEEIEAQIERLRGQFAELEDVSREGFDGDYVLADVRTTKGDDAIAAGSATDMLYEIGSQGFLPGMDEALLGKGAGHIAQFETTLPEGIGESEGEEVQVRVLVKQVKAQRLPELTDEWVDDVSEFETVAEMRAELEEQMRQHRMNALVAEFERALLDDLVEELALDLPEALVKAEMDEVLHRFAHRLEQGGVGFEQYLELTGQDQASFVADLRSQAEMNLRTRILLEAVAEAENLEVEREEVDRAIDALAAAAETDADSYRTALSEGGRDVALAGDILRRKAIDRLIELAVPVDEDGNEIEMPMPAREGSGDAADEGPGRDEDEAPEDDGAPGGDEE